MSLGQFVVPSDDEWIDALGVEPDEVAGEVAVGRIRWVNDHEDLDLTFDVPGNSIRCVWRRGDAVLVDIFREGARQLSVSSGQGRAGMAILFETAGLRGELTIHLVPAIRINDNSLFV
jgi:hypothetical protein